jgi:hypothetical protein
VAEQDETLVAEGEVEPKPVKKRRFPIKTAITLLIIVALGLPVFSMLQPGYYERYPQLRGRIAAWRTSTHARISCADCHVDPGALGYAKFAVKAIPAFYSQLIFGPNEQNVLGVPDRQACQKCHTDYRQVSPNGDLLIPHRAHVEVLNVNCAECHKDLVHSVNAGGFNRPEMEMCLKQCHNGVKATAQCSKCHTRKEVPASHMAKDWLQVHSTKTETGKCGECHAWAPNYCAECHKSRPASHVGNWKKLHGARAEERGTKGCVFCHGEAFCKKCH